MNIIISLVVALGVVTSTPAWATSSPGARARSRSCAAWLTKLNPAPVWRRAVKQHYWLAHPVEVLRAALRTPRKRSAWNTREFNFEAEIVKRASAPGAVPLPSWQDHPGRVEIEQLITTRDWLPVLIHNKQRFLYVRGHGLRQIPRGWVVLIDRETRIIHAVFGPGGERELPPQDPRVVTYW